MALKVNGTLNLSKLYLPQQQEEQQEQKWYKGDQPTMRETLGRLFEITLDDKDYGVKLQNDFQTLLSDKSSMYYSPYLQSTNQAIKELSSYGIDTSNINDDWFNQYKWLENYYNYGTTNTPTSPGKKASVYQKAAYAYWQVAKQNELTKSAQSEWEAAKNEATYWANRSDRNYSDDDVVNLVYKDFAKKYPTLAKMDASMEPGTALLELNSGIDYSRDALYGTVWAARNDGGTGNIWQDMARSAVGTGNVWKANDNISARLDSTNKDTYAPYTVGSTLDDAGLYYGMATFDRKWLEENRPDEMTASKKEIDMWNKVYTAVDFTEKAQAEAADANAWLNEKLDSVKTQKDADNLMRSFERKLDSNWKHLKQMDESLGKSDNLIGTSDAIDYSINDVRNKINEAVDSNSGKLDAFQTMMMNGVNTGTDQIKKAIENASQVVSNMSYMLDDSASPAERKMPVLEKLNTYSGGLFTMSENPIKLITGNEPFVTSDYVSTSAELSADIAVNKNAQNELESLNRANEEIVNKLDMLRDAYNSDYSPIEYLNILKEGEYIDNGYGSYTPNSRYAQALVDLYNDATGLDVSYGEYRDITKRAKEYLDYIVNYQRTYEEDEETPWVMSQYTDRKQQLEAEIERTANAQNEYDKWQSSIDHRISLYGRYGIDTTNLRAAKTVAETMPMFANYEASEWNAYNKYDLMMQSENNGASFNEVKKAAEKGSKDIQEELAFSNWLKDYVTENNIELPQNYMSNLDRHIAKLGRDQTDTDYFLLQGENDFNKLAEEGKKIEENLPIGSRLEAEDENGFSYGQYMTEKEKETYYYLLGKYGASDPNSGYKKAYEYWAYLADPQYGVIPTRMNEAYQEEAKNIVESGVPGAILANAIAILSSPVESIGGLMYVGSSLLNNWELNPDSPFLALGKFNQTVNQETAKEITEALPEGAGRDVALGAYEIVFNRLRSAANAAATGGLSIGGKFGKILTELVGALPVATSAAALEISDAKKKNLDNTTAYLLGGVTLLMEDFTEGFTRSNVKSIFSSGEDLAASSVKDIVKEWLTSSGIEEAFGETLTDAVENYFDEHYAEAFSDHNALVQRIIEEQGLNPDDPVQRDMAEEQARKEEVSGLLHTAFISYLSPGLEAATNTVKVAINDMHNIHVALDEARKNDPSVTRKEIVQEYNAYKEGLRNGDAQQTNVQQENAQTNADVTPTMQPVSPATERVVSETDNAFLRGLGVLDAVENSDSDTQVAAIGVLFGSEEKTTRGDEAKAAAAVITDIFGDAKNAVKDIKGIMSGANQVGVDAESVKTALKTAALSVSSRSNQTLTSNAFKTASLQNQAVMLAQAAAQDAVDNNVQQEIAKNVLESRIAEKEAEIIKGGALDSVDKLRAKADEAIRNIMQAKTSLSERQAETQAKSDAVNAAANEMTANPSNENNNVVKSALAELEKAISVEKEWEQHLEKVNQESADAEDEFNAARDVAMRDIRQQAEAAVQQEDQARAEIAAQQAEQERIAEQQRIDEQENKNFARAQADEIIAENYANASEEDKEKIRGMVREIRNESPITETDRVLARRDYVNRIAKKFGYDIEIGDTTEGGRFLFQNASVNPKTGKIILAKEATVSDAMYAILVHEVTHIAEQSDLYNDMADALLKLRYGDNMDQIEADVAARQELYRNGLTTLQQQGKNVDPNAVTPEYARQELVADMMGELLSGDPELLNRFAAESPSVARRVLDAIKSFLKKMVGIQDAPLTEAQRIVDTLEAALKEVSKNQGSSSKYSFGPVETNTIAKTNDGEPLAEELTGGTVTFDPARYSLSSFNDEEKARVRQALYSAKNPDGTNRFTRKQVDNYIDGATSLAAMIAADKTRLDFKASDNQVFLKPNNDYYFTLDASTLCAKRLLYQGTFDYVQHALPDEVFTPEDLIDLVNIMNDMGYETPCGICYVESRRRWLDTYAQKFLDELPDNADGFIEEYFKKATNEEKDTIREHYAEWNPTIDDLTTSDGLEKLRHANPFMYKAFVDAMNAKGSANPKVVQLRTEYRGDIGKLTANDIQKVKDIGGLRIQSFSDFETPHLLDMVQAVLDMSAVGLTSQAYTKVPNFAWVFGDTGIKINLSLIGKGTGLDENGNLVFDNREGINFDEAMKLRDRYSKNVGTILVGINDEHIVAAMGDPRIDFIIPFHKSGWSAEELRKMPTLNNYKDYTSTQNERVILERVNKVLKEWKTKNDTALKKWIEENGDNYIGYRVENTEKGYRIVFDGYKTESFQKHYERTKEKLSNLEPVGANQYWNFKKSGQWNAENYLKMCAEQHRMPKFYQFLVDNGDGSFSLPQGKDKRSTAIREGYWKTLIDFKMYENDGYGRTKEDGTKTKVKGSEQKEVTPNINMAEAYRVMNEYKLGRQMPNNPDGTPGKFIPMESNNSVPVAVPAAERYIETIRAKRGWAKPEGPGPNTLEADLPEDATARSYFNPRANAFGASQAPAVLGNTEGATEDASAAQQNAMAIDAETGETVQQRFSLPAAIDNVYEDMSTDELFSLLGIDDEEEARNVMTVAVKDIKDEFDPTIYNGKLYVKPDTLDHWLSGSGFASTNPDYAQAYITTMDPADFLRMTTVSESGQNRVLDEATPLDAEKLSENGKRQPIYLIIDEETGKITGHEGRHRSIALSRAGVKEIPVLLFDSATKYSKTPKGQMVLEGQDFYDNVNGNTITFTDVLPLAGRYRDEIFEKYTASAEEESEAEANEQRIIRYSLPSDAPYLSAVDHGDMEEAQRLTDEAAREAGYTLVGYHGTKIPTLRYDAEGFGSETDYENKRLPFTIFKAGQSGGIYMASNRDVSEGFAQRFDKQPGTVMSLYVKFDNPLVVNEHVYTSVPRYYNIPTPSVMKEAGYTQETLSTEEISRFAQENGYDGVIIEGIREGTDTQTDDFIAFGPNQIKLADPVTYDDAGKVIPLSERFNVKQKDIRYKLPSEDILREQLRNYVANGSNAKQIDQEDIDAYDEKTSRPLEGKSTKWTQTQGPAQRRFASGMLQDSDEIAQQAKDYALAHNAMFPDTNEGQINRAINWIKKNGSQRNENGTYTQTTDGYNESLQKIISNNFDYRSSDGQARMIAMMGMAVAKKDVTAQVALADAFNRQGTDLGRALQSRKLFRLMTPEGRIGTLQKMLQNTQDELNAKGTNVELKFSDWIYRAASAATEEGDMQKVMQAAAQELAEQLPANWKDRIRSIRMLSMLGNPRTHIRNIVGNALFVPVVSLKNKLGAIAELGVKQGERTKTLSPFLNKTVREFARQDAEAMKNELTGEAKYNEENAVQREQKAFKGLLQSVIDFNSNMLEKEDWTFLKGHYKRALGGWMQANGYTADQLRNDAALLEKGRAYAIQEAQKATYRDFNKLAATMNDVSRKGGIAGFLVDAVLPFKKTPANILRRGIEYSPVGIMKSLTADLYHLKQYNDFQDGKLKALPEKAITPTQFIDKLCSGLSGTAIMAVGALLSSAGIVSCGLDDDEDKLEKEKGNQEYAFKFSILGHDYTFTMDWAAPMSMPFFVGAAIQEQLAQQGDFDVQELINAFGNITEPVFNLSMLDGVNTLFKTSQYDDTNNLTQIGAKIASNYATSYVPSLLGAIARTVDDKRRKAFVESGKGTGVLGTFRYAMEQTENKIPGLSQTNIPYRDVWGNAETSGLVERILENFILPGYISEYKNDPILNEMDRLYTLTGDAGMIPSDPAKSVTYKKQKYVLNAEQWDEYKAVRGQTAYEMLNNLIQTDDYKTADANVQTQMIKDAWSYADSVGKSAIIPDYELTSKGSNPAQSIAKDAKVNGYKDEMIKALNAGDWEAYDTMVEALHQSEVEDSDIKTKIGNTYRDQYKDAYKQDDWQRMSEIEDILDNTGFSFDVGAWEKQVDQSR